MLQLQLAGSKKLQFGHGGDAVDDQAYLDAVDSDANQLQFGHGGDAVDDQPYKQSRIGAAGGFNSATAVTPWMTLDSFCTFFP